MAASIRQTAPVQGQKLERMTYFGAIIYKKKQFSFQVLVWLVDMRINTKLSLGSKEKILMVLKSKNFSLC